MHHVHANEKKAILQKMMDNVNNNKPMHADIERYDPNEGWIPCTDIPLNLGSQSSPMKYRIKPSTIMVNGIEVPAPETVKPEFGTHFYVPLIDAPDHAVSYTWHGSEFDLRVLERGILHLNRAAAVGHAIAMLARLEK